MQIHQCPKCELRFERKTELDDHCWHDHPEFRHEYAASAPPASAPPPPANGSAGTTADPAAPGATGRHGLTGHVADNLLGWLLPARPVEHPSVHPHTDAESGG